MTLAASAGRLIARENPHHCCQFGHRRPTASPPERRPGRTRTFRRGGCVERFRAGSNDRRFSPGRALRRASRPRELVGPLRKPLSLEVPLIGPDRFRHATLPAYRWPFGRWVFRPGSSSARVASPPDPIGASSPGTCRTARSRQATSSRCRCCPRCRRRCTSVCAVQRSGSWGSSVARRRSRIRRSTGSVRRRRPSRGCAFAPRCGRHGHRGRGPPGPAV